MQFGDGTVTAIRCWQPIVPTYDADGVPANGILFTVIDGLEEKHFPEPPENLYPERRLIVSRDNCPEKAWFLTPKGEIEIV